MRGLVEDEGTEGRGLCLQRGLSECCYTRSDDHDKESTTPMSGSCCFVRFPANKQKHAAASQVGREASRASPFFFHTRGIKKRMIAGRTLRLPHQPASSGSHGAQLPPAVVGGGGRGSGYYQPKGPVNGPSGGKAKTQSGHSVPASTGKHKTRQKDGCPPSLLPSPSTT